MQEDRSTMPGALGLERSLLAVKFEIPRPRSGSVSRSPIIDSMRASGCRVVGLTAPAGYGKTTLLAQWAQTEQRRVGWVSLDRYDDDPAVLLTLLASAFTRISPEDPDLVADMGGLCVDVLGRAAPRLASAFRSSSEPFVLLVDDVHELQTPACQDALALVAAGIPDGSQLVVASRSEQAHLARLRASGEAIELGGEDLVLDVAGARQVFAGADVEITPELAAELAERTEGWPAGLYLAAMIARHDQRPGVVAGDDRYVADYLYRESLVLLPKKLQRFLRRTAVLDQLSGPLCDAVLGDVHSQARLHALESSNSFLVPLDSHREWYRYHGLYREFLLGELRRVEPEVITKLHLRAADWYEANGSPALALEHLLNTGEVDRSVRLVTELILPTYNAGQMSTVLRWLTALGEAAVESHPPLAVLAGWATALTGQRTAEKWAAIADAAAYDQVPLDGTASFESARAMLRACMCPRGPKQMMADATLAVAQEPSWSPWRDNALVLLGHAHLLAGDVDAARAAFIDGAATGTAVGNTDTVVDSEAELALLAIDDQHWDEATEHVERALALIDEHRLQGYAVSVLAFAVAARLAIGRGDLEEADLQLTRGMRGRPSCSFVLPFYAVRARVQLARAQTARGNQVAARHLVKEIDEVLMRRPALGALLDDVAALRETLSANAQIVATGEAPLSGAELRVLPYLQTHLTIAEIGERLFVTRNTVSSEVTSIYRKLGVSSRSEAVERANSIGLLGG